MLAEHGYKRGGSLEIYLSVLQSKMLTPADAASLDDLRSNPCSFR